VLSILHEAIQNFDVVLANPERDSNFVRCLCYLLLPLLLDDNVALSQAGLAGWTRLLKMREDVCRDLLLVQVPGVGIQEIVDDDVDLCVGDVCTLTRTHGHVGRPCMFRRGVADGVDCVCVCARARLRRFVDGFDCLTTAQSHSSKVDTMHNLSPSKAFQLWFKSLDDLHRRYDCLPVPSVCFFTSFTLLP